MALFSAVGTTHLNLPRLVTNQQSNGQSGNLLVAFVPPCRFQVVWASVFLVTFAFAFGGGFEATSFS